MILNFVWGRIKKVEMTEKIRECQHSMILLRKQYNQTRKVVPKNLGIFHLVDEEFEK